jgi:hypothetical protein
MATRTKHTIKGNPYVVIKARRGENVSITTTFNARGDIHFWIKNRSGTNRAKLWWVKRPFGNTKDIGFRTGEGSVKASLWGTLRAGHFDSDTTIIETERLTVFGMIEIDSDGKVHVKA